MKRIGAHAASVDPREPTFNPDSVSSTAAGRPTEARIIEPAPGSVNERNGVKTIVGEGPIMEEVPADTDTDTDEEGACS